MKGLEYHLVLAVGRFLPAYRAPSFLPLLKKTKDARLDGIHAELWSAKEFRNVLIRHFLEA